MKYREVQRLVFYYCKWTWGFIRAVSGFPLLVIASAFTNLALCVLGLCSWYYRYIVRLEGAAEVTDKMFNQLKELGDV